MADFEANEGEFKNLADDHKALLIRLLEIQAKYVHNIIGVTNWTGRYRGPYQKIYQRSVMIFLQRLARIYLPIRTSEFLLSLHGTRKLVSQSLANILMRRNPNANDLVHGPLMIRLIINHYKWPT